MPPERLITSDEFMPPPHDFFPLSKETLNSIADGNVNFIPTESHESTDNSANEAPPKDSAESSQDEDTSSPLPEHQHAALRRRRLKTFAVVVLLLLTSVVGVQSYAQFLMDEAEITMEAIHIIEGDNDSLFLTVDLAIDNPAPRTVKLRSTELDLFYHGEKAAVLALPAMKLRTGNHSISLNATVTEHRTALAASNNAPSNNTDTTDLNGTSNNTNNTDLNDAANITRNDTRNTTLNDTALMKLVTDLLDPDRKAEIEVELKGSVKTKDLFGLVLSIDRTMKVPDSGDISFEVQDIVIVTTNETGIAAEVEATVTNPSLIRTSMDGLAFDVLYNGSLLSTIAPGGYLGADENYWNLSMNIPAESSESYNAITQSVLEGEQASFEIRGRNTDGSLLSRLSTCYSYQYEFGTGGGINASVESVGIGSLGLFQSTLDITALLQNPSPLSVNIDGFVFTTYYQGNYLGVMEFDDPWIVPGNQTIEIELEVSTLSLQNLGLLTKLITGDLIAITVHGERVFTEEHVLSFSIRAEIGGAAAVRGFGDPIDQGLEAVEPVVSTAESSVEQVSDVVDTIPRKMKVPSFP